MIYFLDTDALIFMVRGLKPKARAKQRQQANHILARCRDAQSRRDIVAVSAVTVSELEFGARKSNDYARESAAVRNLLAPFQRYNYDAVACPEHYGRIRHEVETAGAPIGSMDLLIAAQALALGAAVVTNNVAHFRRIAGLAVENWSAP